MRRAAFAAALLFVSAPASSATTAHRELSKIEIPGVAASTVRGGSGYTDRIVAFDTIDEFDRDNSGRAIRARTAFNGHSFSAEMTPQSVTVPGFPQLQLIYERDGRFRAIRQGKRALLSYDYTPRGEISAIELDSTYTLKMNPAQDGSSRQMLHGRGQLIKERLAPPRYANRPPSDVAFDLVRDDLGLGPDWLNTLRGTWNSTGSVITMRNGEGETFALVWRFESLAVVFSVAGEPLFLQLHVDMGPFPTQIGLPTTFTMTPDGRVGIRADRPLQSGIEGFWTHESGGVRSLEYRFIGSEDAERSRVKSDLMYICDQTTVCTTMEGSDVTYCTVTRYWCDYSGGGGGSTDPYDPPPGGGGTTVQHRYNYLSGTLGASLSRAVGSAQTKLANSTCAGVFGQFTAQDGSVLASNLAAQNITPTAYLTDVMEFRSGSGVRNAEQQVPCNWPGTVAWTTPGSKNVYICSAFERSPMTDRLRALRLIHEELHSVGLAENPPVAGAPTDADIDNAVRTGCP